MKRPVTIQLESTTISRLAQFVGSKKNTKAKQVIVEEAINEYINERTTKNK